MDQLLRIWGAAIRRQRARILRGVEDAAARRCATGCKQKLSNGADLKSVYYGRLGDVSGDDAEVGDVVSFFQRGDGVDVENDGGDRSAGLGDDFADVVGDGAELHSGGDVGAAFDEGIPDAGAVGEDVLQFFDPNGIFDGVRIAGEHLQGAHGGEGAIDKQRDVVGLDGAGVTGFHDDGRLAADGSGVVKVAGGGGVARAFAPNDDVVEAEGENHFFRGAVLRFAAGGSPVGVRAETLVEVAAVVVDEVVAAVDDFLGDEGGGAVGLRAVGFAGIETVHALVVDGIDVRDFLFEGLNEKSRTSIPSTTRA